MKSIGLVARTDNPEALTTARSLASLVKREKLKLAIEDETAKVLGTKPGNLNDIDLLVVLGGDGTVLKTVRKLETQVPVLAFNAGTVGFMSEAPLGDAPLLLKKALHGEGKIERCTRLQCRIDKRHFRPALNDVLLLSSDLSKVIHISARKGKVSLFDGVADGAIISTRVGSTAYSMAVGGPILDPEVDAFILNLLYPVRIAVRPILLPVTAEVILTLKDPSRGGYLILDGERESRVEYGDELIVTRASEPALFLRLRENFYDRLHRRMTLEV